MVLCGGSRADKLGATLRFKRGRQLVSNVVDLEILERPYPPRQFTSLAPVLSRPDVARFLYHRFAPSGSTAVQLVEAATPRFSRSSAKLAKELHYTLGRFYTAHSSRADKATRQTELKKTARHHFDKALAGEHLSAHRRRIAENILTTKI